MAPEQISKNLYIYQIFTIDFLRCDASEGGPSDGSWNGTPEAAASRCREDPVSPASEGLVGWERAVSQAPQAGGSIVRERHAEAPEGLPRSRAALGIAAHPPAPGSLGS